MRLQKIIVTFNYIHRIYYVWENAFQKWLQAVSAFIVLSILALSLFHIYLSKWLECLDYLILIIEFNPFLRSTSAFTSFSILTAAMYDWYIEYVAFYIILYFYWARIENENEEKNPFHKTLFDLWSFLVKFSHVKFSNYFSY